MEKDLMFFYLLKIKSKIRWIIQNNNTLRNDLLMYLEICIEVCNLLEREFHKKIDNERNTFKEIQSAILLEDYFNALEYTAIKEKELDMSGKRI